MNLKNLQYHFITGLFLLVLLWNAYLFVSWYSGEDISPTSLMNGITILAYTLCFIGFNWPNSRRMMFVRFIGMVYSVIMLTLSLLVVNDIIGFEGAWNLVIAGMTVSLALSGLFQIYRVNGFYYSVKKWLKITVMLSTVLIFSGLCFIYLLAPSDKSIYDNFQWVLIAWSILLLAYFGWVMFTVKDDRSTLTK